VRARRRHEVRIEIEDTGPGIPPGIIDRIFEPYVRVGGGQQLGLGLGLATVKRFSRRVAAASESSRPSARAPRSPSSFPKLLSAARL
jgi:nitrogen-specific signal transduction histidine kinase